ncbi:MAG: DEAD/DEAH box helicase, partial [Alloprevotella sp.]|nr:DEAD/DEAH box helicase [Alloprevotella sp.]
MSQEQEPEVFFEDLALSDDVLDALYDMRFETCTPVQAKCIPPILENRDVLGVAQTGTGKTAAYLLPLLTLLQRDEHPHDSVNCLVIAPTRELARQIDQALQGFAYYTGINAVAVYGGNDGIRYEQERKSLSAGADIVLATPGRLITHLQLGTLDLSRTTHLVLDEADRMLDMGFSDDILSIVKHMPTERQTILFSATMPPRIVDLARSVMHDPVEIEIAVSKPAENIDQRVYICREGDKVDLITHLFREQPPRRVILFCSSKQKVKEVNIYLQRKGYNARAMHSDLEQSERDEVMQRFRAQQIDILVATDIVARGIDIDDITMVINYDAPHDAEDYVHRI